MWLTPAWHGWLYRDGGDVARLAAQALKTGTTLDTRVHTIVKGDRMLLRITEIPMPNFDMTLGIAYNITREEELETQMKRYQSSNRELLEQLRSAIAIYNTDEKLEFYNSAFAQLWGLEDQWLNTRPRLGDIAGTPCLPETTPHGASRPPRSRCPAVRRPCLRYANSRRRTRHRRWG